MRLVELNQSKLSLDEVLEIARKETVILRKPQQQAFVLAPVDDFDLEIELLRHNKEFMSYLNELSKEKATLTLEEVEKELGL